jgi:hypothetical protein
MAAQNIEQTGAQPAPPGAGYPSGGTAGSKGAFSWTPYLFLAPYLVLLAVFGNLGVLFDLWELEGLVALYVAPEFVWELFLGIYAAIWGFRRAAPILSAAER